MMILAKARGLTYRSHRLHRSHKAHRKNREKFRSYPLLILVGIVIAGLNMMAFGDLTFLERALASAILMTSLIPAIQFVSKNETGIPFLPLFGGIYSIYYALPAFLLDAFDFKGWFFPDSAIEKSLLLSLLGLISLLVAFYWVPFIGNARILPKVSIYWNVNKVKYAATMIGLIGLGLTYIQIIIPIPLILQQLILFMSNFSILAIAMLYILQLQGKLNLWHKLLLWGVLFPTQLILDLSTGAVYQVMKDIIPLIMIYWGLRHRVPWIVIIIGLFLLVLLRGNQLEFRLISRGPFYEELSTLERSKLYAEIVIASIMEGRVVDAYTLTLNRVSHLITFADVIEQTPQTVPYWRGESYYTLLTSLIPRVIWPDKPTKNLGQTFGHRYGRLHPSDFATSENLPQLIEMYVNFGSAGILVGMFIMGLVYRSLYTIINHAEGGEGGILISAIIFTGLLSIESDFSLTFGTVIQYIVLLYILNVFLQRKRFRFSRIKG